MKNIAIYGAGGHARVIIDIIEKASLYRIAGLVDNSGSVAEVMGYRVYQDYRELYDHGVRAGLVAVGDNWQRARLVAELRAYSGFEFVSAVHPSARIGRDVSIGEGTVVMAGCNINPQASIKNHCIVNTGANVDHDCTLGDFASLAPGVTLGGNVRVGDFSAIGLGSSVIHRIEIGEHAVIGAGSVVVKHVGAQSVAYGNPCRTVRTREIGAPYL